MYFYPRSPCGERPLQLKPPVKAHRFLSTLSLRRATVMHALKLADTMLFLSTLSLRRATDRANFTGKAKPYFYPRSPCGERLPLPVMRTI